MRDENVSELDRIKLFVTGEVPPGPCLLVRGDNQAALDRVVEVMLVVALGSAGRPDDWWKTHLPSWFLASFAEVTLDDMISHPDSWDFGSWIDNATDRGWEWWSLDRYTKGWLIRLHVVEDPYRVQGFIHLVKSAGESCPGVTDWRS